MFVNREAICHACDVVANSALETTLGDKFLDRFLQGGVGSLVHRENGRDDAFRLDRHTHDTRMAIEVVEEEVFQLPVAAIHVLAEACHIEGQFLEVER